MEIMKAVRQKEFFLFLLLFIALFFMSFFITAGSLDPDFGWHLRTGELTLERGVPRQDWYSYTMPDFPWVEHEWLTNILMYKAYSALGFYFLLFVFLFIYTVSFFIVKKTEQSFLDIFLPVIFGYVVTFGLLGIRPQLLTVFFVAVLVKIISKFLSDSSKVIYFLPILFLLWVNLHAGFFIGIFILLVTLILEIINKAKFIKQSKYLSNFNIKDQPRSKILILFVVLLLSFLATAINPYGLRIYNFVFEVAGDSFLRFHIGEWKPLYLSASVFTKVYLGLFVCLLIMFRRKINFNDLVFAVIFVFLALSSIRHFLIFVIVTIPIWGDIVKNIKENLDIVFIKKTIFNKKGIAFVFLFTVIVVLLLSFYKSVDESGKYAIRYPEEAVSFIKTIPLSENMFNEYGWGGYFIWKLPERKVFIDGRMPSWRQNGQFVFGDYVRIINALDGFEKILNDYDVSFAVLKNKDNLETRSNFINHIANLYESHPRSAKVISSIIGPIYPENNLSDELKKLGWKTIYQDDTAVILKK